MVTHTPEKPVKTIPYLKEPPIIGKLPAMLKDRINLFSSMAQLGEVSACHIGPLSLIMLNKAKYVQPLLIEHAQDIDKGEGMHKVIVGNGIFISEGELHRRQRKIMAPSFQPRHIASYADTMTHYGEQIQQGWHDGDVIDLNSAMTELTMSIIGKTLFDADIFNETDEMGHAMAVLFRYMSHKLSNPFSPLMPFPTPENIQAQRAIKLIEDRVQQMIDIRRNDSAERNDMLSVLLSARDEDGNSMDDLQLRDECTTLFGAGHETTATALAWSWYLLCQHPDVYQKMQQEINDVLQARTPSYTDLPRLPYTLQVFKETLRLYPPAYAVSRQALRAFDIDGYHIPKGSLLGLSIYVFHHDPEYFPEPEKFMPERFEPEREKQIPRNAYLPFGAGSRICIGNHFALMEGHLLLATLAQRVSFELVPGQHIVPDATNNLTLRPGGKVQVVVRRR